jgi:7-cyano-7-deazaguanine reductase
MKIESNIVDPYVGQTAEGMTFKFEMPDAIRTDFLKVFLFDSPEQEIITETREFQAVCPFSGLPDVGRLTIKYHPTANKCVELKALKYYLVSFKNVGLYQEGVTARIYKDLKELLQTNAIEIETEYNVRGGFTTICKEGDAFQGLYDWRDQNPELLKN